MKKTTKTIAMTALASLLMLTLSSCGSAQDTTTVSADPVTNEMPFVQAESEALPEVDNSSFQTEPETIPAMDSNSFQAEPDTIPVADNGSSQYETGTIPEPETASDAQSSSGRQDGERFQDVITLEGTEETVSYEHIKNDTIGIELDYDYENFERRSGPASECIISRYDNIDDPENYLEVFYSEESADSAAASIAVGLANQYTLSTDSFTLKNAGTCTRIDASATKDGQTPDKLQTVYVIPLNKGCAVATAHYTFEAAEGFGRRFSEILNTLTIMSGR